MLINASPRTQARAAAPAGNSGGSGYVSSRYSRIASDWKSFTSPSISVGTTICGFSALYSAGELVALLQMQKRIVMRQPFQVQRDAHPETRLRAVIGRELHRSLPVWPPP